jgi:hypothetical protein
MNSAQALMLRGSGTNSATPRSTGMVIIFRRSGELMPRAYGRPGGSVFVGRPPLAGDRA